MKGCVVMKGFYFYFVVRQVGSRRCRLVVIGGGLLHCFTAYHSGGIVVSSLCRANWGVHSRKQIDIHP